MNKIIKIQKAKTRKMSPDFHAFVNNVRDNCLFCGPTSNPAHSIALAFLSPPSIVHISAHYYVLVTLQ